MHANLALQQMTPVERYMVLLLTTILLALLIGFAVAYKCYRDMRREIDRVTVKYEKIGQGVEHTVGRYRDKIGRLVDKLPF